MNGTQLRWRSAPAVARELRIDARRLREWLRKTYPRSEDDHGARWHINDEMLGAARRHFER